MERIGTLLRAAAKVPLAAAIPVAGPVGGTPHLPMVAASLTPISYTLPRDFGSTAVGSVNEAVADDASPTAQVTRGRGGITVSPANEEGRPRLLPSLAELLATLRRTLAESAEMENGIPLRAGDYGVVAGPNRYYRFQDGVTYLPTVARVSSIHEDYAVMDIPYQRDTIDDASTLEKPIPLSAIRKASFRNWSRAASALDQAIAAAIAFAPKERVRAREEKTGAVLSMEFVKALGDFYLLRGSDGRTQPFPKGNVYKDFGPGPVFTPSIPEARELGASFDPRLPGMRSFLKSAALLSSHPEYHAASHERRWRFLSDFILAVVQPEMATAFAEKLGLRLPELLELGYAACRHFVQLACGIMCEAGYDARILAVREGDRGHVWNIVGGPPDAGIEPYLLDLMNEEFYPVKMIDNSSSSHPGTSLWGHGRPQASQLFPVVSTHFTTPRFP